MAKNEVATTEGKKFDLVTISGELVQAVAEEMDGLGAIPFEKVKIPSGGGLAFELPGKDEDHPITATELVGVILDHHPVNAYWENKYSGGNEQPDCSSYDGKHGVDRSMGEVHDCSTCPHNQFGSDGAGKACKNIHRCYILQEGNPVPLLLALPPTSLKYLRDYIAKKVLLRGMRCWDVVTKISLKKEKSSDNITYSRAAFSLAGTLQAEQREEAKAMAESIRMTTRSIPVIDDADYNMAAPTTDSDGFMEVPQGNDDDLPFN